MLEGVREDELARRLEALERKVEASGNLLRLGIPLVSGLDSKVNALIDSEIRLYEAVQKLTESHQQLTEAHRQLTEAQSRTEDSLRLLIDTLRHPSGNGNPQT